MDWTRPFVLLDDARSGHARLFTACLGAVTAPTPADVPEAFAAMRRRLGAGEHLAGHIAYEAGYGLEARLAELPAGAAPVLWLGRFGAPAELDASATEALFANLPPARVGAPEPQVSAAWHAEAVAGVQQLIAAGDIYQANLTFPAHVTFSGHPAAVYALLRARALAPYGALVFTGARWLLSLSPELFFTLHSGTLAARPMKGTAARAADPAADTEAAATLAEDPKNRAENLMITDLLRNDLSRVAEPGSVRVPELFAIEPYPSVWQMTSSVTARLSPGHDAVSALAALFPCGSVTGAPKLRAQQVIAETEPGPRGAYCGAIGTLDPEGGAAFNVAIRTLAVPAGGRTAVLGLGSGIVADSVAADEWDECLAKARFLHPARPATLLETAAVMGGEVHRLEPHLARMATSAARFGFPWDAAAAREAVRRAVGSGTGRLRLAMSADGGFSAQFGPAPPLPEALRVRLVPLPVAPSDWRLRHKTGDRAFYDNARRRSGADEVLFVLPDGQLTEGSFTSLFVPRGGVLLTPPAALGLLPGVLRAELLATKKAAESCLSAADLTSGFLLGNSLRGLLPGRLA